MYSRSSVKHTYTARGRQLPSSSSTSSPPSSPPLSVNGKRKRTLLDCVSINSPPPKRAHFTDISNLKIKRTALFPKTSATKKPSANSKQLTQLHFVVDSVLRTCPSCGLSYTKGAIDDEILHKKHCARVQRGLEWGKEEEKEAHKAGVRVIEDLVRIKSPAGVIQGRIISVPADIGGKIGAKITSLLETINLTLSAPDLSPEILKCSKVYLFLVPSSGSRERVAGCAIAQRIKAAMNVVAESSADKDQKQLVRVDGALFCSPQLHPTPLGISRLFVPSAHRRQGIATRLLTAAARTFVHGCVLNPANGEVAFSQPTGDGRKVMECWGKGGVRVYQE